MAKVEGKERAVDMAAGKADDFRRYRPSGVRTPTHASRTC